MIIDTGNYSQEWYMPGLKQCQGNSKREYQISDFNHEYDMPHIFMMSQFCSITGKLSVWVEFGDTISQVSSCHLQTSSCLWLVLGSQDICRSTCDVNEVNID